MSKPVIIDGKVYRKRRGKLVEVPAEWVGKVPGHQTINARPSKQPPGQRKPPKRTRAARRDRAEVRENRETPPNDRGSES